MFIKNVNFHPLGKPEKFEDGLDFFSKTLQEIRSDYVKKHETIQRNLNLSEQGKHNALNELNEQTLKAIRGLDIDESIKKERERANNLMTRAFSDEMEAFEKQNPVYRFLVDSEIRQYISEIDPAKREIEVRAKVQSGDVSWLHALKNDPIPGRIVKPAFIAELTAERAEQLAPDAAALEANARQFENIKQANIKALMNDLKINEPVDDWVSKIAAGEKGE